MDANNPIVPVTDGYPILINGVWTLWPQQELLEILAILTAMRTQGSQTDEARIN
ncbi:hypothetical protein BT69DRAFT_1289464 [Atractiella rhizophila]|nr:hypothetical protein BT69DRAFT_1289464 [Atractiella rhizophila]